MIIRDNFGKEHICELQSRSHRNPHPIELVLYALGLLVALSRTDC
jgi:hypothetical protein